MTARDGDPADYWNSPDGTSFRIRPIRPDDEAAMVGFHGELTDATVYGRYFELLGLSTRTAHERLARVCRPDEREAVLVVEHEASDGERRIVAVGRLSRESERPAAEFAIVVGDRWQRRGLGSELLRRLVAIGRETGVEVIWADMLAANTGMRRTAERTGFTIVDELGSPTVSAELRVARHEPTQSGPSRSGPSGSGPTRSGPDHPRRR